MAAAVVPYGAANRLGDAAQVADQILDRLAGEIGMPLERAVELGDVGRVVLVVVDPHRLLVDVRLERVVVVRQRGQFVGHRRCSFV